VPLPLIEMMAKLTADDFELRLAKNTEILGKLLQL
jgi:hypothetical protein